MHLSRLHVLRQEFMHCAAGYIRQAGDRPEHILLKRNHSLRVHALARHIVMNEELPFPEIAVAAALVHDIGRFSQYAQYGTYRDDLSVDHGTEGARVLAETDVLRHFSLQERHTIIQVTRLHNKRELPLELDSHVRTLCHVVRDADKLDIIPVVLRSMQPDRPRDAVVTLGLDDSPELWSPHVLETALAGQSPAYTQLRYLNDFKILLATWGPGLIFASSRKLCVRRKSLERIQALLPVVPPLTHLCTELSRRLLDA